MNLKMNLIKNSDFPIFFGGLLETFTVENKSNIFYIYFTFIKKNDETYEILLFNEDIRQIVYEFNIKNPERTYKAKE